MRRVQFDLHPSSPPVHDVSDNLDIDSREKCDTHLVLVSSWYCAVTSLTCTCSKPLFSDEPSVSKPDALGLGSFLSLYCIARRAMRGCHW